jgi:hypothetical protein
MHTVLEAPPRRIMRILTRPRPRNTHDAIGQIVSRSQQVEVDAFDSVYPALGRLVRDQGQSYLGVFVQIDGLEAEELEFFSQAARLFPRLPIYVHATTPGGRERLALAVALGATGPVHPSNVESVWQQLEARATIGVHAAEAAANAGRADGNGSSDRQHGSRAAGDSSNRAADMAVAWP